MQTQKFHRVAVDADSKIGSTQDLFPNLTTLREEHKATAYTLNEGNARRNSSWGEKNN